MSSQCWYKLTTGEKADEEHLMRATSLYFSIGCTNHVCDIFPDLWKAAWDV